MWRKVSIICVVAALCGQPRCLYGAGSSADIDAASNERFPVDRTLLEKQWGINCEQAVDLTLGWLKSGTGMERVAPLPMRSLKYCGLLFNTPDTGRYQPCPDYESAYQRLVDIRQHESIMDTDTEAIEIYLSDQCLSAG
ncbi:MAG: hypothetical protein H7A03_00970 [Pseudomonadales bacterium]|nr:hypothetical protein [Pseudomonadales bacterium]